MNLQHGIKLSVGRWLSVFLVLACASASAQSPQEHVHAMAHTVMPFDMSKTLHVFRMTESGGVLRVVAKDAQATDQIDLIRQHLRHESVQFGKGDYADPGTLHGQDMPGLKEIRAAAGAIKVSFAELPDGASITFETRDLHLLTALHRWFGAQLSEHGADAKAE